MKAWYSYNDSSRLMFSKKITIYLIDSIPIFNLTSVNSTRNDIFSTYACSFQYTLYIMQSQCCMILYLTFSNFSSI